MRSREFAAIGTHSRDTSQTPSISQKACAKTSIGVVALMQAAAITCSQTARLNCTIWVGAAGICSKLVRAAALPASAPVICPLLLQLHMRSRSISFPALSSLHLSVREAVRVYAVLCCKRVLLAAAPAAAAPPPPPKKSRKRERDKLRSASRCSSPSSSTAQPPLPQRRSL